TIFRTSERLPRLDPAEEAAAVAALKKREPGDTTPPATDEEKEAAFVKLAGAYSSTLRKHRREHRSLYEYLGEEEAQELALLGVIRAAQKATEPYLSGVILDAIAEMFAEHSTSEVYVPPQMIRRFRRIMDRAGNDPEVGLEICETPIGNDSAMSRETFQQIYDALPVDGLFESADDAEAYGPGAHLNGSWSKSSTTSKTTSCPRWKHRTRSTSACRTSSSGGRCRSATSARRRSPPATRSSPGRRSSGLCRRRLRRAGRRSSRPAL